MDNGSQASASQFRPMVPNPTGQPFHSSSQQFPPVGQVMPPPGQFMQQYPPRPGQAPHPMASSQGLPMSYIQSRPGGPGPPPSQQPGPQFNNQMPALGGPGMPFSSSYSYAPSSFGHTHNNANPLSQFPPMTQMQAPVAPAPGQPWLATGNQGAPTVTPVQQGGQQSSGAISADPTASVPGLSQQSSEWQEHASGDGRRYYYNKRTKQSVWDKPVELMTPLERADASTVWKEYSSPDGRKYYYNKVTKQSKWTIPEELKLARELAQNEAGQGMQVETPAIATPAETPAAVTPVAVPAVTSLAVTDVASPVAVTPVASLPDPSPTATSVGVQSPMGNSSNPAVSASTGVSSAPANANSTPIAPQDIVNSVQGTPVQDIEEAKKGMAVAGKVNATPAEDRSVDDEPLVYANKLDAKNAFKSLLESASVQSDWSWEQTMREIINDKRYGALKTLGERKQAFNEFLGQKKKQEIEERRTRQKKAREEFTKMLEECKELTSTTRWSKAVNMLENDERFKAVERTRDKEDLFESYIVELERKEKEKVAEEHRRHVAEYRKFLETCDFIKVNSQYRKIQDRLEDDERCLRLEKLDRLLIFQDHIRELEKEEEEQKKIQKEHLRRAERKNRDEFRKVLEEHVADGLITAKTQWREYCAKVKDLPQYEAVASNTSGSTPKDLYEDVAEELEKQYHEDKARVKDVLKLGKISVASNWSLEEFKAAVLEDVGSPPIPDVNLKFIHEELLERAREKEEKESKKRQRLADDFTKLLHSLKEIIVTSNWEESKHLFDESQEYRSIGDDIWAKEIFEEYMTHLQEKAKEKERKREEEKARKEKEREDKEKRKEKEKKEKDRDREKEKGKDRSKKDDTDSENMDIDSHGHKEDKRREKDRDRKHRKRHQSATDEVSSDRDEKEDSKKRKHSSSSSDRKKSRKHAYSPESDSESRHRKHRRDHRDSRRNGGNEELEDGELGEDGEIQ